MKHPEEEFIDLLLAWNKKHNIIGNALPRELLNESSAALSALSPRPQSKTLVDIGAGSGIMGIPWITRELSHDLPPLAGRRLVFVEPDKKSAAFLALLRASVPFFASRSILLDCRLEDVRRETIGDDHFLCVSRAFSPAKMLGPLYKRSELRDDPLLIFLKEGGLQKIEYVD